MSDSEQFGRDLGWPTTCIPVFWLNKNSFMIHEFKMVWCLETFHTMLELKPFLGLESTVSLALWRKFCSENWPWNRIWCRKCSERHGCNVDPSELFGKGQRGLWLKFRLKILETTWWTVCVGFPLIVSSYPPNSQENLQGHWGCWPVAISM